MSDFEQPLGIYDQLEAAAVDDPDRLAYLRTERMAFDDAIDHTIPGHGPDDEATVQGGIEAAVEHLAIAGLGEDDRDRQEIVQRGRFIRWLNLGEPDGEA